MRFVLLGAWCVVIAGPACAQTVPQAEALAPRQSLMLLNVSGGKFQSYVLETAGKPVEQNLELTIESVNPDPEWAASAMICAVAKSSTYEACLRVSKRDRNSTALSAARLFFKDEKRMLLSQDPVAGNFEVGNKIRIALRSRSDAVEFKVDDGAWLMQALPFTPEALRLVCSSALCKLQLNEVAPLSRP